MGFNTWNTLMCMEHLNEGNVTKLAKRLRDLGFVDLGYEYFVIDDCWQAPSRDRAGKLVGEKTKFPSGMKNLSGYVHSLGFKFGIYTDRGTSTCTGRPASQGHEREDAATFASWDVDFVKNDGCSDHDCWAAPLHFGRPSVCNATGKRRALRKFEAMHDALNATGRHIVHSLSAYQPWYAEAGPRMAHMWRVTEDVRGWQGVYLAARTMEQLAGYHGPGTWNDPDMLIGSSGGDGYSLEPAQSRAQFSLYAVMGAPLMLGMDVLRMSAFDLRTYSNREAVRVNQDPLGAAGRVVVSSCGRYPRFRMGVSADGSAYNFDIDTSQLAPDEKVHCGNHMAGNCSACDTGRGRGRQDCWNHCAWDNATKTCKPNPIRPEDEGVGWHYINPKQLDCQQAWAKTLQNGDVALAVVNFGRSKVEWILRIGDLVPWGDTHTTLFKDLWSNDTAEVADDTLWVKLPRQGGHKLWRLSRHGGRQHGSLRASAAALRQQTLRA